MILQLLDHEVAEINCFRSDAGGSERVVSEQVGHEGLLGQEKDSGNASKQVLVAYREWYFSTNVDNVWICLLSVVSSGVLRLCCGDYSGVPLVVDS